ncbi:MAG: hypothetical protein NWQ32_06050, partial [Paracoccaceae bacterium]|nr:hypothetical protein [Paracoccaceae bacterium]
PKAAWSWSSLIRVIWVIQSVGSYFVFMANGFAFADKSAFAPFLPRAAGGDEATFASEGSTRLNMQINTLVCRDRITAHVIFL